jgi:hypothetical protein
VSRDSPEESSSSSTADSIKKAVKLGLLGVVGATVGAPILAGMAIAEAVKSKSGKGESDGRRTAGDSRSYETEGRQDLELQSELPDVDGISQSRPMTMEEGNSAAQKDIVDGSDPNIRSGERFHSDLLRQGDVSFTSSTTGEPVLPPSSAGHFTTPVIGQLDQAVEKPTQISDIAAEEASGIRQKVDQASFTNAVTGNFTAGTIDRPDDSLSDESRHDVTVIPGTVVVDSKSVTDGTELCAETPAVSAVQKRESDVASLSDVEGKEHQVEWNESKHPSVADSIQKEQGPVPEKDDSLLKCEMPADRHQSEKGLTETKSEKAADADGDLEDATSMSSKREPERTARTDEIKSRSDDYPDDSTRHSVAALNKDIVVGSVIEGYEQNIDGILVHKDETVVKDDDAGSSKPTTPESKQAITDGSDRNVAGVAGESERENRVESTVRTVGVAQEDKPTKENAPKESLRVEGEQGHVLCSIENEPGQRAVSTSRTENQDESVASTYDDYIAGGGQNVVLNLNKTVSAGMTTDYREEDSVPSSTSRTDSVAALDTTTPIAVSSDHQELKPPFVERKPVDGSFPSDDSRSEFAVTPDQQLSALENRKEIAGTQSDEAGGDTITPGTSADKNVEGTVDRPKDKITVTDDDSHPTAVVVLDKGLRTEVAFKGKQEGDEAVAAEPRSTVQETGGIDKPMETAVSTAGKLLDTADSTVVGDLSVVQTGTAVVDRSRQVAMGTERAVESPGGNLIVDGSVTVTGGADYDDVVSLAAGSPSEKFGTDASCDFNKAELKGETRRETDAVASVSQTDESTAADDRRTSQDSSREDASDSSAADTERKAVRGEKVQFSDNLVTSGPLKVSDAKTQMSVPGDEDALPLHGRPSDVAREVERNEGTRSSAAGPERGAEFEEDRLTNQTDESSPRSLAAGVSSGGAEVGSRVKLSGAGQPSQASSPQVALESSGTSAADAVKNAVKIGLLGLVGVTVGAPVLAGMAVAEALKSKKRKGAKEDGRREDIGRESDDEDLNAEPDEVSGTTSQVQVDARARPDAFDQNSAGEAKKQAGREVNEQTSSRMTFTDATNTVDTGDQQYYGGQQEPADETVSDASRVASVDLTRVIDPRAHVGGAALPLEPIRDPAAGGASRLVATLLSDNKIPPLSLAEALQSSLYDQQHNCFVVPSTNERISLMTAIDIGLIDGDTKNIADLEHGEVISVREALERGIIDAATGLVSADGETFVPLNEALASGLIMDEVIETAGVDDAGTAADNDDGRLAQRHSFVESFGGANFNVSSTVAVDPAASSASRSVQQMSKVASQLPADEQVVMCDPCQPLKLVQIFDLGLYDPKSGRFRDPRSAQSLSLNDAIRHGVLDPNSVVVNDPQSEEVLSLDESIRGGLISGKTSLVIDTSVSENIPLTEALRRGILVPRPMSIMTAIDIGLYDESNGMFFDPTNGLYFALEEAVESGLIDPHSLVVDPATGKVMAVAAAMACGVLDAQNGNVVNIHTGEVISLKEMVVKNESLLGTMKTVKADRPDERTQIVEQQADEAPVTVRDNSGSSGLVTKMGDEGRLVGLPRATDDKTAPDHTCETAQKAESGDAAVALEADDVVSALKPGQTVVSDEQTGESVMAPGKTDRVTLGVSSLGGVCDTKTPIEIPSDDVTKALEPGKTSHDADADAEQMGKAKKLPGKADSASEGLSSSGDVLEMNVSATENAGQGSFDTGSDGNGSVKFTQAMSLTKDQKFTVGEPSAVEVGSGITGQKHTVDLLENQPTDVRSISKGSSPDEEVRSPAIGDSAEGTTGVHLPDSAEDLSVCTFNILACNQHILR